jgi:predicted lysophospholipase L1 biosynthesis ABC-type transport system permease subunit
MRNDIMSTETKTNGHGGVAFPLKEVFALSIENMRVRFGRTIITMISILLGIAFLTFLMTTAAISSHSAEAVAIRGYQYWLAFISILVCVVSITNSMLIAVYERFNEIGTMKCLGALDRHILMLFFTESGLLGLIGGLLGFAAGFLAALVSSGFQLGFSAIFQVPSLDLLLLFVGSIVLATGLSVFATIYPAYKAAKSSPVEALRFEI